MRGVTVTCPVLVWALSETEVLLLCCQRQQRGTTKAQQQTHNTTSKAHTTPQGTTMLLTPYLERSGTRVDTLVGRQHTQGLATRTHSHHGVTCFEC